MFPSKIKEFMIRSGFYSINRVGLIVCALCIASTTLVVAANSNGSFDTVDALSNLGGRDGLHADLTYALCVNDTVIDGQNDTEEMKIVDEMPAFGKCTKLEGDERHQCTQLEIIKHITKEMHYPKELRKANIQGFVYVYFVVGEDGMVRDTRVMRPVHPELDKEALRVVNSLPRFEPGKRDGKPEPVQYTVPVKFILR